MNRYLLFSIFLAGSLFGMVRTGIDVEAGEGDDPRTHYYEQVDVYYGPGWYNGVWFGTEWEFDDWHRHHHHDWHHQHWNGHDHYHGGGGHRQPHGGHGHGRK